jgi:hypothetical protein
MVILLLFAATTAIFLGLGNPLTQLTGVDRLVVIWVFSIAGWPLVATFLVAPLLWGSIEEAGSLIAVLVYTPGMACSGWAFISCLRSRQVEVNLPAALIATLFVFGGIGVWSNDPQQMANFLVATAMFGGVLLKRGTITLKSVSTGAVVALGVTSLAVTVAVIVNAPAVLESCREDKCGASAQVLTSPFAGNGNILGLATAVLVTMACASAGLWRSVAVLGGVGVLQILAGSRTAMFGVALVGLAIVVMKVVASHRAKVIVGSAALVAGAAASLYPLTLNFSGSSFAYRGYIWKAGRDAIAQAPVFGRGPGYWHVLQENALFDTNYSPHNGWYDLMVSVGGWGVLLILAAVILQLATTSSRSLPYLLVYYGGVLAINTFESVFVPFWLGITPLAAIVPFILYEPKAPQRPGL